MKKNYQNEDDRDKRSVNLKISTTYLSNLNRKKDFYKGEQRLRDLLFNNKQSNLGIIGVQERRERIETGKIF